MKKTLKYATVFFLLIGVIAASTACYAQSPIRKLGRGVANFFTGPFEIPKSVQEKLFADGPVAAVTYGVFDGIYKSVLRCVAGVYEVATFPIPIPAEYDIIVEPEFLFGPDEPYVFDQD